MTYDPQMPPYEPGAAGGPPLGAARTPAGNPDNPAYAAYPGYYPGPMPPATSGWAIASLACALLGIFGFPLIGSILSIIFGLVGLNEIAASRGTLTGRTMARISIAISIAVLVIALVIACLVFLAIATHRHRR